MTTSSRSGVAVLLLLCLVGFAAGIGLVLAWIRPGGQLGFLFAGIGSIVSGVGFARRAVALARGRAIPD